MSFKKTSFEGDFCSKAVVAQEISPKISTNNMREVKIEFQENNNGLHFLRRPSFFMGIFFYACHYQMTDSLSFRNESYRFIFDLWVINGRQNYRFEMIPAVLSI